MVSIDGFLSNMVSIDGFLSNMVSIDGLLSNMVTGYKPYSQRILEISLPDRFLPQNSEDQRTIISLSSWNSKHNEELTTEGLMELHRASQQEVMEESLSEEEKVTAK
ncbi:hypothetical protein AVEN_93106-1 [Araneus ventricosus]|uniref:Uncharacterized protein n=1 Tax=Araneus ventricosus TaxID=182803 RepID=A0A4Y2R2V0_ARAVE|nr:hypothetical protein AVEN_93106-1 [Araneus ventricosus]